MIAGPLMIVLAVVAVLTAGSIAVRSVSRIWLRHWAERQLRGAIAASTYLERPQRLLGAAAAGTATAFVTAGLLLAQPAGALPTLSGVVSFGIFAFVLGQLVPRAIARRWATTLIPVLVPVLRVAEIAMAPVLAVGRAVGSRLGVDASDAGPAGGREAIETLLREGAMEGVGEDEEIAIISGVVAFREKRAADVMTPRKDIFALDATLAPAAFKEEVARSGYSRVPVFRGSLDDVFGMVHAFDVLKVREDELPAVRPVGVATPDTPANQLLFDMLRERRHLSVVREPDGRVVGLVTLEDLLEELVGDIRDEHDEPPPDAEAAR